MKNLYLVFTLCVLFQISQKATAQCSITPNNVILDCSTPCAVLTVNPMPTDYNATTSYTVSSIPFAPYSYTTGTLLPALSDDIYSAVIPLPFPFCYFGNTYNSVLIGSNANLCFDLTLAGAYDPWSISGPLPGSNSTGSQNCIMFSWMDYLNTSGGGIYYATYGTAPCRVFVVSYNNVAFFSCTSTHGTQQVVLYEGTNVIEMNTQNKPVCSSWNSGYAVTGIENAAGTLFYTAPGQNGTSFTASNQSWRFAPAGATSPWTYTWTGPGGAAVGVGTSVTVCPTSTTNYTVTATTTACTGGIAIKGVSTVTKTSSATPILGTPTMCLGYTTSLSNITAGGVWTSGNPGVATVDATGLVSSVSGGTSTISYTVAGCSSTLIVTVNTAPPITGLTSNCVQNGTILTDAVPGGTWMSSNTGVATISPTGVITNVSSGTTVIMYTTPAGCTTTVTINPVAPVTGVLQMCQKFTTTLADAFSGGSWSSTNTSVATVNAASGVVSGLAGGTATIIYTLPTGCAANAVVTVHPTPAPPTPTAPFRYCQFDPSNPVGASGSNLLWYGPGVTVGSTTAPTPGTSVPGTITYYVTQTSSFGCVSDSATDVITIFPQPSAPVTHDTTYCQFYGGFVLPLNYEVDSAAGSRLNWFAPSGSPLSGTPVPTVNIADYPAGTVWHVSQTINGCTGPQSPIKVTVIPTPKFDLVYRNWVCQHDSVNFAFNLTGGSVLVSPVYYWQLPFGAAPATGNSIYNPNIDIVFDTALTSHSIGYFTISNLNGQCSTTDTFNVHVVTQPHAHSHCRPDICKDDTVTLALSDQSSNAEDFFWKIDGTSLANSTEVDIVSANSNSGGPYSLSWNNAGQHIISLQCGTHEGCLSRFTFDSIYVHGLPDALFSFNPKRSGVLCLEDSLLFSAHLQDANANYLWQPEHCFNNNNKSMIWGRVERGRTDITLTVTDPFGCKSTTSQQLSPDACCTVLFPSAFSPNGDTKNDKFRPIFNGYHNFHTFKVVNRWGQTVFESTNSTPEWDGNFNGAPQDIGVYYYYIKYDCGGNTVEEKGDCTLVR